MNHVKEVDFCGIYLPPFFLGLLIAGLIYFILHHLLDRVAIHRWVWNRAVFEAAVFVILLAATIFVIT